VIRFIGACSKVPKISRIDANDEALGGTRWATRR